MESSVPSPVDGPFPIQCRELWRVAKGTRRHGSDFSDIPGALQVTGTASGFAEEGEPGGEGDLGLLPGPVGASI